MRDKVRQAPLLSSEKQPRTEGLAARDEAQLASKRAPGERKRGSPAEPLGGAEDDVGGASGVWRFVFNF